MAGKKGKGGKRGRGILISILLIMLVVALANAVYVYMLADRQMRHEQASTAQMMREGASGEPVAARLRHGPPPEWHGYVLVSKAADGGHDITIAAVGRDGEGVPLTSFDVRLTRPGKDENPLSVTFVQTASGTLKAHVDFPAPGTWQAHVRLHRERASLIFNQRIDIEQE